MLNAQPLDERTQKEGHVVHTALTQRWLASVTHLNTLATYSLPRAGHYQLGYPKHKVCDTIRVSSA